MDFFLFKWRFHNLRGVVLAVNSFLRLGVCLYFNVLLSHMFGLLLLSWTLGVSSAAQSSILNN